MFITILLLLILIFFTSLVAVFSGFGLSSTLIPLLALFLPASQTIIFVSLLHWLSSFWETVLFYKGISFKIVLLFGIPSILLSFIGGYFALSIPDNILLKLLGFFLLTYSSVTLIKPDLAIPPTAKYTTLGGALAGFSAGFFGIGGALKAGFLIGYHLPPITYIATLGSIGLLTDTARIAAYWSKGIFLPSYLWITLLLAIPVTFASAWITRHSVISISQTTFRTIIKIFLCCIALKFILFS